MTELELRAENVTNRFSYHYGYLKAKDAYIEGVLDTIHRAIEWCDAHTEWDSTFATEGEKSVHNMFIKAMKGETV